MPLTAIIKIPGEYIRTITVPGTYPGKYQGGN